MSFHAGAPARPAPWSNVTAAGHSRRPCSKGTFGHVKGAFTGARLSAADWPLRDGHNGTYLLDEVADMFAAAAGQVATSYPGGAFQPASLQHRTPDQCAHPGGDQPASSRRRSRPAAFARTCSNRLNVVELNIPSLRERPRGHPAAGQRLHRRVHPGQSAFASSVADCLARYPGLGMCASCAMPWSGRRCSPWANSSCPNTARESPRCGRNGPGRSRPRMPN